jgi:hypothetical protein
MIRGRISFQLLLAALILTFTFAMPALAQERSATRSGFTLPADGSARILLFRPKITVGAQSTGGMFEPRAEWTEQARKNIDSAIAEAQGKLGNVVVRQVDAIGPDTQIVAEYQALFDAVAQSVITYQFFKGNRLETKKRDNRNDVFNWMLGPDVSKLPGADQADYALFILTKDHYGSTGRKIFQILAAVSIGYGITSGLHAGYAALVDLRTGNVMWINADNEMGGDVRTADGARHRVTQLLEDFPGARVSAAAGGASR